MTRELRTWESLESGINAAVRGLPAGMVLQLFEVARLGESCLAQFWQTPERLTVELPGADTVAGRAADADDRLVALGWQLDPAGHWTTGLAWP
ncbi:MAG: hypothetical protein WCA46_01025, partial [Actinocatenispora sp.]